MGYLLLVGITVRGEETVVLITLAWSKSRGRALKYTVRRECRPAKPRPMAMDLLFWLGAREHPVVAMLSRDDNFAVKARSDGRRVRVWQADYWRATSRGRQSHLVSSAAMAGIVMHA
jgi:hypothetical protein